MIVAATSTKMYWYLTRSTGAVTLVLLTMSLVLGILQTTRFSAPRLPRFVTAALHRNVSLLVVVTVGVHIATAVLDSFAPITVLDVFIPFRSQYRPLWLGFGALALDLLIALTVTSLLRGRLGYRSWRIVHWLSYGCWIAALVHALGTGSDTRSRSFLLIDVVSVALVIAALWWRIWRSERASLGLRALATAAVSSTLVAVIAWTAVGPLHDGWARRAGTPTSLIASFGPAAGRARGSAGSATTATTAAARLTLPVAVRFDGVLTQGTPDANGNATVVIDGVWGGANAGRVHIVLQGAALSGGGVEMQRSRAYLGSIAVPTQYHGAITGLRGSHVEARVRAADGGSARVTLDLLSLSGTHVSGRLVAAGRGSSSRGQDD